MANYIISQEWIERSKDCLRNINQDFQEVLYELQDGYDPSDAMIIIANMKTEMFRLADAIEWGRAHGRMMPKTTEPIEQAEPIHRNWTIENEIAYSQAMNSHERGDLF